MIIKFALNKVRVQVISVFCEQTLLFAVDGFVTRKQKFKGLNCARNK